MFTEENDAHVADVRERIKVVCKIRPLSDKEHEFQKRFAQEDHGHKCAFTLEADRAVLSHVKMNAPKRYAFDHVFSEETTQQGMYDAVAGPVVDDLFKVLQNLFSLFFLSFFSSSLFFLSIVSSSFVV